MEQQVQQYLYEHIPLSKAMGVEVKRASTDEVMLAAPLAPNINHRETVFGGSASAVGILSAWTLLHLRLTDLTDSDCHIRLVIQRNSMQYEAPIEDDFTATCAFIDSEGWERFMRILDRHKRARLTVQSVLECRGKTVGRLEGDFVAIILQ